MLNELSVVSNSTADSREVLEIKTEDILFIVTLMMFRCEIEIKRKRLVVIE